LSHGSKSVSSGSYIDCTTSLYSHPCYGIIFLWSNRVQGGGLPAYKRGEVVRMNTYEVLSLLFLGGTFLIALLAYIDRNNKRK